MAHGHHKSGTERGQASLLPARVDDYVSTDNPVRAIDAYAQGIDLAALGFKYATRGVSVGQPPYSPADLLKLYLYGYLNRVRSSRALEREARRNLEVMWLLRGQAPGYRTIAKFRADNAAALRQANRDFVRLLGQLDLLGGSLVAIDGAFFDGNASKGSIITTQRLAEKLPALDRDIDAYAAELATRDAEDAAPAERATQDEAGGRMAALLARRERMKADLAQLEASGETQLSRTDPDARLLSKSGQSLAGYNVQIAVDEKHKLIVASEVVNDGNDTRQLHPMAQAAKQALAAEALTVTSDAGYYDSEGIRACEADGIEPIVPIPERGTRATAEGRFGLSAFRYDPDRDVYHCPAEQTLHRMAKDRHDASGKRRIRYASRRAVCRGCPLRAKCLSARATRREIERWEHEEVVQQHRLRMAEARAQALLKRRKALAEHPFGTLKCRAGYRHFLVRRFAKVRGEWGLMALCYNLGRVLRIIGRARFIASVADFCAQLVILLLTPALPAVAGANIGRNQQPAWATPCTGHRSTFGPSRSSVHAG